MHITRSDLGALRGPAHRVGLSGGHQEDRDYRHTPSLTTGMRNRGEPAADVGPPEPHQVPCPLRVRRRLVSDHGARDGWHPGAALAGRQRAEPAHRGVASVALALRCRRRAGLLAPPQDLTPRCQALALVSRRERPGQVGRLRPLKGHVHEHAVRLLLRRHSILHVARDGSR